MSLLVEFGANLNLVKWESLGPESRGRRKVDPEALQVFKEARSKWPEFHSDLQSVWLNQMNRAVVIKKKKTLPVKPVVRIFSQDQESSRLLPDWPFQIPRHQELIQRNI